jgi:hypothetical protein
MNKVKTYEQFINEEINLKKAITGAALGASLAISNPVISQTDTKKDKIESIYTENDSIKDRKVSYNDIDTMSKENGFNLSLDSEILSNAKSVKLSYTLAYIQGINIDKYPSETDLDLNPNSNFYQAPAGALFGIHIDNFSIYLDCKWFGKKDYLNVSNWSNETILDKYTYTYEPYAGSLQYGTYTTYERGKKLRTGYCEQNNKIINLSLGGSKDINLNGYEYCFRGFLGMGVLDKTKLTYQEVYDYWYEFTNWNLINDYTSDGGGNYEYSLVKKEKVYELNVHGGIIIEGAGVFAGIGFDTNPGSLNISFGYTFGNK